MTGKRTKKRRKTLPAAELDRVSGGAFPTSVNDQVIDEVMPVRQPKPGCDVNPQVTDTVTGVNRRRRSRYE